MALVRLTGSHKKKFPHLNGDQETEFLGKFKGIKAGTKGYKRLYDALVKEYGFIDRRQMMTYVGRMLGA
jgi:hypothetical protein